MSSRSQFDHRSGVGRLEDDVKKNKVLVITGVVVTVAAVAAIVIGLEIHRKMVAKKLAAQVVPVYTYLNVVGNYAFNSTLSTLATSGVTAQNPAVNLMTNPSAAVVPLYLYCSAGYTDYTLTAATEYGTSTTPPSGSTTVGSWGYCYTKAFATGCIPLYACFLSYSSTQYVSVLSNTPTLSIGGNTLSASTGSGGLLGYTWDGTGGLPGSSSNPFSSA